MAVTLCYKNPVPGLIPKIDGNQAILFHVEHSAGESWHYRWRIVGDYPAAYLVWREHTTTENHVRLQSEIRDCRIEVEWRPHHELPVAEADPVHPWLPVSLFRLTAPTAVFSIHAENGFTAAGKFTACAAVRDDGVAAYRFPAMQLDPGVTACATARADAPAWANVLLAPGEFRPRIPGITITNVAPATQAWMEEEHEGLFQLARCPHAASRRWFSVGHDSVAPSQVMSSLSVNPP